MIRNLKSNSFFLHCGATLVELMVACSVMSLLFVLLFQILSATTTLWRRTENNIDSYREARAALDFIARELSHVTGGDGTFPPMLLNVRSNQVLLPQEAVNAPRSSSIFFTTHISEQFQAGNDRTSERCGAGYYLACTQDDKRSSAVSFKLYRHFVNGEILHDLLGQGIFKFTPDPIVADEILARNIIDFSIVACQLDQPKHKGPVALTQSSTWSADELPDFLDITLSTIPAEAASRILTSPLWHKPPQSVTSQKREFSTRITLRQ